MSVYYMPGWNAIAPSDVQVFNTMAEAATFRARRDRGTAMGHAAQSDAEIAAYMVYLHGTATQYGFQGLTPTEREVVLTHASMSGVAPPFPITLPAPSAAQIACADGYNSGISERPPARRRAAVGQLDITISRLPPQPFFMTIMVENTVRGA